MALMLRMSGIPARVVSGFSPGSFNSGHAASTACATSTPTRGSRSTSPTSAGSRSTPRPPAAPADRAGQGPEAEPPATAGATARPAWARRRRPRPDRGGAAGRGRRGSGRRRAVAGWRCRWSRAAGRARRGRAGGSCAGAAAPRRVRDRPRPGCASSSARCPGSGWPLAPGTTLLELERRLARAPAPGAAGYVARLREGRFSPARRPPARPRAAGALRRELTAAGGLRARLRGFRALPPGRPAGFLGASYGARPTTLAMSPDSRCIPPPTPLRPPRRAGRARRSAPC